MKLRVNHADCVLIPGRIEYFVTLPLLRALRTHDPRSFFTPTKNKQTKP